MSLDCGRKQEYPKRTHTDMWVNVNPDQKDSNPGPSYCEAQLTTAPPCHQAKCFSSISVKPKQFFLLTTALYLACGHHSIIK